VILQKVTDRQVTPCGDLAEFPKVQLAGLLIMHVHDQQRRDLRLGRTCMITNAVTCTLGKPA
jgi:hypothetical protein